MAMINKTTNSLRPEYDFLLSSLAQDPGSRGLIYRAIPSGSRVLDVGCDTGRFGQALIRDKQCKVDGIEAWEPAAELAKARLNQVFIRSAETEQSFEGLKNYDAVLFLCVLEHLQDPWAALKGAFSVLQPGGSVYIVVPNIAHVSIVRRLLRGQFDYAEHGTMDRTHLRWFTRRSLKHSMEEAGFSSVKIQITPLVPFLKSQSFLSNLLSSSTGYLLPDLFGGSIIGQGIKH